jgi:hypothetical protein
MSTAAKSRTTFNTKSGQREKEQLRVKPGKFKEKEEQEGG